jgi:hypothetical protein
VSRRPAPLVLLIAAATAAGAGGCLYLPGINGQPDAEIEKLTGVAYVDPYEPVKLSAAQSDDPDGSGSLTAYWRATRCEDEEATICPQTADDQLQEGDIWEEFHIYVTERRPIRVTLIVEDSRGARDSTELVIDVANKPPELNPQPQGYQWNGMYPVGSWIDVLANGDDPDGDPVQYSFDLFAPDGSTDAGWAPCPSIPDCMRLTPDVAGVYEVRVTAEDDGGGVLDQTVPLEVADDAAPCAHADPLAGGIYPVDRDGGLWKVGAWTEDDLDGDQLGDVQSEYYLPVGPSYAWQMASPDTGGELLPVAGLDAGELALDPSVYAPGDRISIRLEIADRIERTLPCDDSEASCSIDDDAECVQRVTWEVEIQ